MLADFVVKHKKQVVKLFAVVKWARDAEDVQKCMVRLVLYSLANFYICIKSTSQNITAFLMDQNAQFEEAVEAVTLARDSLAPAR